jgi:hypothetical protein
VSRNSRSTFAQQTSESRAAIGPQGTRELPLHILYSWYIGPAKILAKKKSTPGSDFVIPASPRPQITAPSAVLRII